jgi:hypothetical protein
MSRECSEAAADHAWHLVTRPGEVPEELERDQPPPRSRWVERLRHERTDRRCVEARVLHRSGASSWIGPRSEPSQTWDALRPAPPKASSCDEADAPVFSNCEL